VRNAGFLSAYQQARRYFDNKEGFVEAPAA
jgi:hypothetical protein